MDPLELVQKMMDQMKEGQEAVRSDIYGLRKDVTDVKHSVVRLEERLEHVREQHKDAENLEQRVRHIEDHINHSRGRDRALAFGLGAAGGFITLMWSDLMSFIKGVGG